MKIPKFGQLLIGLIKLFNNRWFEIARPIFETCSGMTIKSKRRKYIQV